MASYVQNRQFGQTDAFSLTSSVGFNYGAGGTDASPTRAVSPGISSGSEGGASWYETGAAALGLAAQAVGVGAQAYHAFTDEPTVAALPPMTPVYRPPASSSSSTILLLAAAAVGVILLTRKPGAE